MDKKDLVLNIEFFNSKGNKGKIIKLEEDAFTILWIDTKQIYEYPYDEGLLKSLVLSKKEDNKKTTDEDKSVEGKLLQ